MIDHSNWCLILTDGWCSCRAEREPVLIFGVTDPGTYEVGRRIANDVLNQEALCNGSYHCTAPEHVHGCYSQDLCQLPDCPADKPHLSHIREPWKP